MEPACQCDRSAALHAAYLSSLASEGVTLAGADFVAMQTRLISLASSRRDGSLPPLGTSQLQLHLLDREVTNAVRIARTLLAHMKTHTHTKKMKTKKICKLALCQSHQIFVLHIDR